MEEEEEEEGGAVGRPERVWFTSREAEEVRKGWGGGEDMGRGTKGDRGGVGEKAKRAKTI